jgi:hypothetical protein
MVYKRRAFRYNPGMSETDAPPPPKKGINGGMWVAVGVLGFLAWLANPWPFARVSERARSLQASNNCRQIMIALKSYAGDHNGRYPDAELADAKISNDVFRLLIKAELLEDERIFSSPASPFLGDNDIGEAPGFKEAVEAGENHWCLVKGLTDETGVNRAFVFENPVDDNTWPPIWNVDEANRPVIGRAWKGGRIVIGRNDGSVNPEKLISPKGPRVPLTDEVNAALFPPGGSFLPVAK